MKQNKKVSAFAVFKGKNKQGAYNVPREEIAHASRSDSNLPRNASSGSVKKRSSSSIKSLSSRKSISSSSTHSNADAKRLKSDLRKLKNSSHHNDRAYLPDEVLNSPLNSVQLTSLKSKKSVADLSEPVESFVASTNGVHKKSAVTPPPSAVKSKKPAIPPKPKTYTSPQTATVLTPLPRLLSPTVIKRDMDEVLGEAEIVVPKSKKRKTSHGKLTKQKSQVIPYMWDSSQEANRLFEVLIHPVKPDKFFSELWEKKPLLVKRHLPQYNEAWFSTAELDRILRQENVHFSVNLDITSYKDGQRETHNPPGRAYAPLVWDYYQNGCSVRLLNPQTYCHNTWKLLSTLQEYFGCMVGANIYLTPPGTQGFAPHYDDIEAFILQLEGKKHWRLYSPRSDAETLPKHSSKNFGPDDDLGEPILNVILEAGDLLYFPRGVIHQGDTPEDAHSLHITVSTCQKNTWGDLLEKLLPAAVQVAFEEDIEFRQALPRDYLNYMGVANQDSESPERTAFLKKIGNLFTKLLSHAPVDGACDQMAVGYIHDSLPPALSESEKECSIHGCGERWHAEKCRVVASVELEPDTPIKIIRKGALRLVEEENVRVYHILENSRVYHGNDVQFIDITEEAAPAVEHLLHTYPKFCKIDDLPLDTIEEKVSIASTLYDKGLLITCDPLQPMEPESSDEES